MCTYRYEGGSPSILIRKQMPSHYGRFAGRRKATFAHPGTCRPPVQVVTDGTPGWVRVGWPFGRRYAMTDIQLSRNQLINQLRYSFIGRSWAANLGRGSPWLFIRGNSGTIGSDANGSGKLLLSRVRIPNLQISPLSFAKRWFFRTNKLILAERRSQKWERSSAGILRYWSSFARFLETHFVGFCWDIMLYHEWRPPVPRNMVIWVDIAEGQNCEPSRKRSIFRMALIPRVF